jgi:hypothetical protein
MRNHRQYFIAQRFQAGFDGLLFDLDGALAYVRATMRF